MNLNDSFRPYYIHYEDYVKSLKKIARFVTEIYKKALKSKF